MRMTNPILVRPARDALAPNVGGRHRQQTDSGMAKELLISSDGRGTQPVVIVRSSSGCDYERMFRVVDRQTAAGLLVILLMCVATWRLTVHQGTPISRDTKGPPQSPGIDSELEAAADGLLAGVNPMLPSNRYFPRYVKDKLLWFRGEYGSGRADIRFFRNTPEFSLPPDIVMVSMRTGDQGVILISKPRLASDLQSTGPLHPPFTARQLNDFAISLVHEIVHLQHPEANPENPTEHAREELRVWREVTINAVRPLRLVNQPLQPRFLEVDDVLRSCNDSLPCPGIERLVRVEDVTN
jgi:hypothetical protein